MKGQMLPRHSSPNEPIYFDVKALRASFSAADPFTHCQGVRGFLAFANSG